MIQDLHSHTYYSFCGEDAPQAVIEAAIAGGINMLGINDHNYGVGSLLGLGQISHEYAVENYRRAIIRYLDHLRFVADRYRDRITVKCGIEIATENQEHLLLPEETDISMFDYCLIEHIDSPTTAVSDMFGYAKRCGCHRVGIAHTDLFSFAENTGVGAAKFFTRMADEEIFWELNVNYDPTHHYREHEYVKRFLASPEQQDIIRRSGVRLSVGFDGHHVRDYAPERVRACCEQLEAMGIPLVFADET